MNDLKLPKLPKNYRWKIDPAYNSTDAVFIRLQKKSWFGWTTVRKQYAWELTTIGPFAQRVELEAKVLYNNEFVDSGARQVIGIYYGE